MSRDHPGKKESHCEGMPHTQDVHTNAFHWSCWSSPPRSLPADGEMPDSRPSHRRTQPSRMPSSGHPSTVSSCLSRWHLAASLPGTPFLPFCLASSPSAFPLSFFQSWLRYWLCRNVLPNFLSRGLAAPTLRPSLGYSGPLALVYDSVFPTSPCAPGTTLLVTASPGSRSAGRGLKSERRGQ